MTFLRKALYLYIEIYKCMDVMDTEKMIAFFKALSDETRQKILTILMSGEKNVTELVEYFNMSQPTISHHLNILKIVGLVSIRKDGKQIYYRINCSCIENCCNDFFNQFGFCFTPKGDKKE